MHYDKIDFHEKIEEARPGLYIMNEYKRSLTK